MSRGLFRVRIRPFWDRGGLVRMRSKVLIIVVALGFGVACSGDDGGASTERDSGSVGAGPDASGDSGEPDADASDDTGADPDTDDDPDADDPNPGSVVDCAPLPAPADDATIVEVDPSMVGQLPQLVRQAEADTTFVLAAGTYELGGTLHIRADRVTLRSADDDAESVVIDGAYNVNSLVLVNGSQATIAHLTLRRALHHPIHVTPAGGDTPANNEGARIYGVRIVDGAQQFIKINPNGARSAFVDNGLVACSSFELTDAGRPRVDRSGTGCYTGGVDAHGARGWVVRDNHFKDIYW